MEQTAVKITKNAAEKIKNLLANEEPNMKMRLSIQEVAVLVFSMVLTLTQIMTMMT